jgi:CopG family nickel-responsive transcriptional regulator
MTSKGENLEIISFSVHKELARKLEKLTEEMGYTGRSELIRDAVRMLMRSNRDLDALKGEVSGTAVLLYSHSAGKAVSEMRHRNMDVIISFMHSDFGKQKKKCCEVLMFSGQANKVRGLVRGLKSIKDVEEVQVFLA